MDCISEEWALGALGVCANRHLRRLHLPSMKCRHGILRSDADVEMLLVDARRPPRDDVE